MPVMDGWDFRVKQRTDPALADIPVVAILLTAVRRRARFTPTRTSKPFSARNCCCASTRSCVDGKSSRSANAWATPSGWPRWARWRWAWVTMYNALGAVTANVELASQALPRMQWAVRVVRTNPMHQQAGEARKFA